MKRIIILLALSLSLVSCNKMLNDKVNARVDNLKWFPQTTYTHTGYIELNGDTVIVNTTSQYCITIAGDTAKTFSFSEYGIATITYDITNTGMTGISRYAVIIDLLLENGTHMCAKTEGCNLNQTDHNTIYVDTKGKRIVDMKFSNFYVVE